MPIDLLPPTLAILAATSWALAFALVGLVPWGKSRAKRIVAAASGITVVCVGVYVFRYHGAELLYGRAAAAGDSEAQYRLGDAMAGRWTFDNGEEAIRWLRASALQGHVGAQLKLACLYELRCTDDGMREAIPWLERAAAQGHQDAVELLALARSPEFRPCDDSGRAWEIIYKWTHLE